MPPLPTFKPKRGSGDEARLKHIEDFLAAFLRGNAAAPPQITPPSSGLDVPIPESDVTFDPDAGHAHDGTDSHTVDHANLANVTSDQHHPKLHQADHQSGGADALTGSVDANARVNVKKGGTSVGTRRGLNLIEGTGVTLTVADNSGSEQVDVTIDVGSSGTTSALLGAWVKQDITTLPTTGYPGTELYTALSKGANDTMSIVCPSSGAVTGLSVFFSGDIGGVGTSVSLDVVKNGAATGFTIALLGDVSTEYKKWGTPTSAFTVVAGDELTINGWRSGGENAVRMTVYLWGYFS